MTTRHIPKIPPAINDPAQQHEILYDLAKRFTNEEIFIGLIALEEPFTAVHCLDDIFVAVRHSIRVVARNRGVSEDHSTEELLAARKKYGVTPRNREQIKAGWFVRSGREEAAMTAERQAILARGILSTPAVVKNTRQDGVAAADTASIRERMSLKNILN